MGAHRFSPPIDAPRPAEQVRREIFQDRHALIRKSLQAAVVTGLDEPGDEFDRRHHGRIGLPAHLAATGSAIHRVIADSRQPAP
jgi:hypothetical protein